MPISMHETFMRRALELAAQGQRTTMPNPMVGAVVVCNGTIIGEGYHKKCGGPHAEVHAIESVAEHLALSKASLYVSLEPCSHFGRTPPCADLIIRSRIPTVFVACRDPFPEVSGRGIEKLRNAGINVIEDVLRDEAILLNRRFMISHREKRPYVILKWAQTSDGFLAHDDFSSQWISCEASRVTTHRWRADEMAILVGTTTARVDNPELTVRHVAGTNPLRVVIDKKLSIPATHKVFDYQADTLVLNYVRSGQKGRTTFISLNQAAPFIQSALTSLYERKIQSILVEGGSQTLQSFIQSDLWDEARVFVSPKKFGTGIKAPSLEAAPHKKELSGEDTLLYFQHPNLSTRLACPT